MIQTKEGISGYEAICSRAGNTPNIPQMAGEQTLQTKTNIASDKSSSPNWSLYNYRRK